MNYLVTEDILYSRKDKYACCVSLMCGTYYIYIVTNADAVLLRLKGERIIECNDNSLLCSVAADSVINK